MQTESVFGTTQGTYSDETTHACLLSRAFGRASFDLASFCDTFGRFATTPRRASVRPRRVEVLASSGSFDCVCAAFDIDGFDSLFSFFWALMSVSSGICCRSTNTSTYVRTFHSSDGSREGTTYQPVHHLDSHAPLPSPPACFLHNSPTRHFDHPLNRLQLLRPNHCRLDIEHS